MDDDDDWNEFDESFLQAVDQLVAQHQTKATQLTQPDSPTARQAPPRPMPAGPQQGTLGPTSLQQHQQWPVHGVPGPRQPLQNQGGPGLPTPAGAAPLPPARLPASMHPRPPQPQQAAPAAPAMAGAGGSFPMGRVSLAAAELRGQPAAQPPGQPGADLQALLLQMQQERDRLQQQLGSTEGTNKLLRSNLDQAQRDKENLRQRLQQLESKGAAGNQSAFTLAEMQKQMDALKQQLMFREQELEDLKRQQTDKVERLREAEAAVRTLQTQIQGAQQAKQQLQAQLQRNGALDRAQAQGASPSVADPQRSSMRPPTRVSGQKRRQSAAGDTASAALQASPAATVTASRGVAPAQPAAPLLGAAVLQALSSHSPAEGLVSRLWAICGDSLRVLLGAGLEAVQHPAAGSMSIAAAAVGGRGHGPTALLLRQPAQVSAAADAATASFCQAFGQQLQQVASGQLAAAALVDSAAAMAAAVVLDCSSKLPSGTAATPGRGAAGFKGQRRRSPGPELSPQQALLLSAGLNVLQHLLEQDGSCREAAACSCRALQRDSGSSTVAVAGMLPGAPLFDGAVGMLERLQLSHRVRLTGPSGTQQQQQQQQQSAAHPAAGSVLLPQCQRLMQQHSRVFCKKGAGLAAILVATTSVAGQRHMQVLEAALGAMRALAAGLPVGGGREALQPVLETGALEQFLRPPALRVQALQLLHLLLEEPCLVQVVEQSLAHAAANPQAEHTPHSTGGTAGGAVEGSGGRSGEPGSKDAEASNDGAKAMQVDEGDTGAVPWAGAPTVMRRLLQSLSLPLSPAQQQHQHQQASGKQPAARRPGNRQLHPQQAATPPQEQAGAAGQMPSAAVAAAAQDRGSSNVAVPSLPYAVPRQALQVVALLREQHLHSLLSHLIQSEDSGNGAGSEGLCQRLMLLAEAASAQQGPDAAVAPLFPAQYPSETLGPSSLGGRDGAGGVVAGGADAALTQLAWQQRLRLVQEALTLLRGLIVDESVGGLAAEELCSSPSFCRMTLASLGRIMRLEVVAPATSAATERSAAAGSFHPLPLAPWAQAIGSSSTTRGSINPGSSGTLVCCSVEDVVYMARSMRHRMLHRLKSLQQN